LAKHFRSKSVELRARNGTGLGELFLDLATGIDRLKRKETKLETNVNCQNLGKALLDVLEKVSKGFERLHWMILVVSLTGFGMGERRSWGDAGFWNFVHRHGRAAGRLGLVSWTKYVMFIKNINTKNKLLSMSALRSR